MLYLKSECSSSFIVHAIELKNELELHRFIPITQLMVNMLVLKVLAIFMIL